MSLHDESTGAQPGGGITQAWSIEPLPDFLTDHTLPGQQLSERLREHATRWVQFISALWSWREQAAFAIRFTANKGRIRVAFLARSFKANEQERLLSAVSVLLRVHRLTTAAASNMVATNDPWLFGKLANPAYVELHQFVRHGLWKLPLPRVQRLDLTTAGIKDDEPITIYPWWGLGGPFLLPMESLVSQPVACSLTAYLQPTELTKGEWYWLTEMGKEAQSMGEQNMQPLSAGAPRRAVDPSANLAGRLYIQNLRRLSSTPFLVKVHCAAAHNREDVAIGLADGIQALVQENPLDTPRVDDERLPTGASFASRHAFEDGSQFIRQAHRQYERLSFDFDPGIEQVRRLPYLVDAKGAATVFRFPVSVRGGVPGIEVRQLPPYFIPGPRTDRKPPKTIAIGDLPSGGEIYIPVKDLTKHTLVTGFTGSGKTVTVFQILHQLAVDHQIPFLVLESAKQEYRGLMKVQGLRDILRVYSVGNERCVPLRLNPFELLPGVRVESHISKLQTCIEGAIPPIGPSSSVIAEALFLVYRDRGWSLLDIMPRDETVTRPFPTLDDFVERVKSVIADRGYEGEVLSNVNAALVGRFKPLQIGGKGLMFGSQRSFPRPEKLFTLPTILELNDLNLDDKALVVMFILMMLREYREMNRAGHGELKHITVVEEAHNVLENVASKGGGDGATSADTRFKAVEAFCQLLTEIRALGEGLIIADQSPEKLARDAMRNTNLQLAHQLRDSKDRDAVASAMIMENEQRDFLGKLRPGQAALFRTGLEKATFVQIPKFYPDRADVEAYSDLPEGNRVKTLSAEFRGYGFEPVVDDEDVARHMDALEPESKAIRSSPLPFLGCRLCRSQCQYREVVFSAYDTEDTATEIALWDLAPDERSDRTDSDILFNGARIVRNAFDRAGIDPVAEDAAWCFMLHMWELSIRPKNPKFGAFGENDAAFECFLEAWSEIANTTSAMPAEDEPESDEKWPEFE